MELLITPTAHERAEWSRLAQDAYRTGRNFYGHRYSPLRRQGALPLPTCAYDALMRAYRAWLVFGWTEVETPR